MTGHKENFSYIKGLMLDSLIHGSLLLESLALSYSTYKKYNRSAGSFPAELKIAIKATFPWALIIFIALFILYGIWQDKKDDYRSIRHYVVILIIQAVIINLMFFAEGTPILIVQNLAILYFVGFLLLWSGMKKIIVIDDTANWAEEIVPPIIYKSVQRNMPAVRAYLRENPSRPFVVSFIILFIISALLLILGGGKAVEQLEGIAYFLLLIGIGIELYQLTNRGNVNGKKTED